MNGRHLRVGVGAQQGVVAVRRAARRLLLEARGRSFACVVLQAAWRDDRR